MRSDFYTESMPYENFIRRAHKCMRQSRLGADQSFMRNLMLAEAGSSYVSHLPKYDKQFPKVQNYISKALDKILKWKLTDEEKQKITFLKVKVNRAYSTSDLMSIVEDGLSITQRFKES